ncbi:PD-(D/E)XK nuclease family protein [Methylobacterium sp. 37f]|uniref:PD-(D/E)XK nuclease family protein n=1 Tax=Methylobacterium sp. 37f TaxID=2817058 RepID=UPI001FFD92B9|nr:PD-(D/E)XK nuclease family protein [Methylobacterium sp. 37f]MCK2056871.1 PD-(D/E)XK nuclease family protein [Methylobacterium sp. 37f]
MLDAFNPVALLLIDEMDLSRVIGWMLDPAGTHGQGDRYLRHFLDLCGINAPDECRTAKVRLEVPRYAAGRLMGRIDIEVSHPRFLVLVENKPTARFGDRQLERYARTLPRDLGGQARVVTLLGTGWDGPAVAAIERAGTRALKLGTNVRGWVAACQSATTMVKVAAFLGDFEAHLDKRYAGKDAHNVQQIINLLAASPETVAASIAIMDARDALTATVNDRFAALVQQRAHAVGLGDLRPIAGEMPLFSPNRNGMLRLDIGDPRFDFAISAESTNFRGVALGLCLCKWRRGTARIYAGEIARLREALGPGQIDQDEWWLWWDHVASLDASGRRSVNPPDLWAWAADAGEEGLAAAFVNRAVEAKEALSAIEDVPEG